MRQVEWKSGQVLRKRAIGAKLFGEGSVRWKGDVYMLTWKARTGLVLDGTTFAQKRTFKFSTTTGEGWGITHDGSRFIVSDGSSWLHFWDPETLKQTARVQVKTAGRPVTRLNELEFVGGEVLANVWFDTRIARIHPATGTVLGWIDAASIHHGRPYHRGDDVLNGIAVQWSSDAQPELHAGGGNPAMPLDGVTLFATGKRWDKMYRLRLKATAE